MPKPYYLDSAPLVSCADARIANPVAGDVKVATAVAALIEGPDVTAISEITILEVHSVICDHWRMSELPLQDAAWADGALGQLMAWIGEGRLEVLPSPPKLAEMAMLNVEEVTRRTLFQLRAFDAAHLVQAAAWSRVLGERVTLVTWDGAFKRVMETTSAFAPYIELLDPRV